MRILALLFFVLCAMCVLMVRSRLPPKPGSSVLPDLRIYRQPAFALTTVGVFFNEWALFIPITYISSFIISTGAATPTSNFPFMLIAILNAGSTVGRYLPGLFADRVGRFDSMIAMLFLCIISNLGLWLPSPILPGSSLALRRIVIAYVLTFGFASGKQYQLDSCMYRPAVHDRGVWTLLCDVLHCRCAWFQWSQQAVQKAWPGRPVWRGLMPRIE